MYYSEAPISFPPTYKYNNGTDDYDTSFVFFTFRVIRIGLTTANREKARIPAWCDRVVWKGKILKPISYNTAPLRISDHRPVYAAFGCLVSVEDEAKKAKLSQELHENRLQQHFENQSIVGDTDEDVERGFDFVESSLPPASSDRNKWWLADGESIIVKRGSHSTSQRSLGLPASSTLAHDHPNEVPNPRRLSNPFSPDSTSDWVFVAQMPRSRVQNGSS